METVLQFLLASLLIELTPGPNMAFLALVGATEGRRRGFATVAGITLGLAVVGLAVAAGLGAVITGSPVLFQLLRWGGVVFLLYLAWEGWREAGESSPHRVAGTGVRTYFRHGLVVNLLNPKAALFFVTVLPTFAPALPDFGDLALLTALYVGVATGIHLVIVTFASLFNPYLSDPVRSRRVRQVLALLLAAVAVWFAWNTRSG